MIDWESKITGLLREDSSSFDLTAPEVFHCSWMGSCRRQVLLSKLRAKRFDRRALGSMKVGSLIHEWLENEVDGGGLRKEERLEKSVDGVTFTGKFDAADDEGVYDFKTTSGLKYVRDSPKEYHVTQLCLYMWMLGLDRGKLVYIGKNRLSVVEHEVFFDYSVVGEAVQKALDVKKVFEERGKSVGGVAKEVVKGEKGVPFEKCGCWLCGNERLKEV